MKKTLLYLIVLLVTTTIFSQTSPPYYNGLDLTKTGNELFLELSGRLKSTHIGIPYTGAPVDVWDACKEADEDPDIATNVLLIYGYNNTDGISNTDRTRNKDLQDSGGGDPDTWNREHVFPKSLANPSLVTDEPGPGTDVHNLRPADSERNSLRGNRKFTDGSGTSAIISSNGGWYPGDEWKGDVARIIMYMYTRYHGGTGTQISETNCLPINVGFGTGLTVDENMIELFLNWNVEDPVSDFESNRNEVLFGIQENRNPYVDNPYLATLIWGGLIAEDKWDMNNTSDPEAPTAPTNLVSSNITDESFDINWSPSTDNIGVYDYSIYINDVYLQTSPTTNATISNLDPNTEYSITIKARDASSNYSNFSSVLLVKTLEGPTYLFEEDFEDCSNLKFFSYNEASDKNWTCNTQFGENNSGSIDINGYNQDVSSKDWLITTNPIDFDGSNNEKISFYTDAAYGDNPLALVYSSNYDGNGNPSDFTWTPVPNITIPIKSDTSGNEEVFTFEDVDISSITGSVYFAFKYYVAQNEAPTRWTVDSFEITADLDPDVDGDGVLNEDDLCANTPNGESVDGNGCAIGQLDDDNDGVQNSDDNCADTPSGENVDENGCSQSQIDDDGDGIMNDKDACPETPVGDSIDANGCAQSQLDDDGDGVNNLIDQCPNTPLGTNVNEVGCFTIVANNFKIETVSETCPNKNNGILIITAIENFNYNTTINGTVYNFTNNLEVDSLAPGTVSFCITVEGQDYEQCYSVNIEEGTTVAGKAAVSSKKADITISQGTAPFSVLLNGQEIFKTNNSTFSVDVSHGDLIQVQTKVNCEGVFSKQIDLFGSFTAYPNPTTGNFEIGIPVAQKAVTIELYNIQSQLISSKVYPVLYGKVKLNIENIPVGIYLAKIVLDKPVTIKIIKN